MKWLVGLCLLWIVWKSFKWAYKGTRTGCFFGVHDPDFSRIERSGWYSEKTLCRVCSQGLERDTY